jgi:hypothetical protein
MLRLMHRMVVVPGLTALLVVSVACDRRGGLSGRFGELVVVVPAAGAGVTESLTREARVAVPGAPMGETSTGLVTLRNVGDAPVDFLRVKLTSGSTAFALELPETIRLEAQQETTMAVTFSPEQAPDVSVPVVPHLAVFELETSGGRPGETTAIIELVSTAEARDCFVPPLLDFGEAPLSQSVNFPVSLANSTQAPATATVSTITGADPAFFSTDLGPSVEVDPGTQTRLHVRFSPQAELEYRAELRVRRRASCPEGTVVLVGRGSSASLTWAPRELDLGRAPIGETSIRQVVFANRSGVDVSVSASTSGEGFSTPTSTLVLPARSSVMVEVRCTPVRLGAMMGMLAVDLGTSPLLPARVPLRCSGGGPRLRASPSPLSFGFVPLLLNGATTVPLPREQQPVITRRLRLENVGTPPANPTDTSSNLILGREGQAPLASLAPLGATEPGEFSVSVVRLDPVGVPAVAGRNFIDLEVTLQPAGLGPREALLTLYSNDPVEPVKQVRLSGVAQQSNRCSLFVTPVQLNFGDLPPDSSEMLTVTLSNTGRNACLVSGVELASATHPGFSTTTPPSFTLGPGQAIPLQVTFSSRGLETGVTASGALRLVGAGEAPRLIPLNARVARCLVAVPDELDFGTLRLGCRSTGRTVQLFNTCGAPTRLVSLSTTGAGFSISAGPMIPAGGLLIAPSTSVPVTLTYAPPGQATHTGSITLTGSEGTSTRSFSVPLRGTGDLTGITTETYQQPTQPVGDVLFTIDDSCSMADEQMALGTNFASFIRYATMANLDYRIAVITTDDFSQTRQGRFVTPSGESAVITQATPQVSDVFRRRVAVGVGGSGSERPLSTTLKALTAPLSTGANAGFLRDDANLAIIIVSDAQDQSGEPIANYTSRIPLVKGVRRRHQVSVSVIGPFSPASTGCQTEGQDTTGRYDAVIQATRGVKQTICKSNWGTDLEQLGRSALGPRNTFFVRNPPDTQQPVDVTVNGQTVSNAWNYDGASNAIVFADGQAPGSGTTVTITYQSMCL